MMHDNWTAISGKTALQIADIDQAEALAERLITAIGLRDQGPAVLAESAENRQKAFTLFVNTYDQIRRVISYLRWNEGDVDQIAPSLYAGRNTGRRKSPDPQPTTPATPSVPTAPSASTPANGAPPVGVDLPQSSPFVGG